MSARKHHSKPYLVGKSKSFFHSVQYRRLQSKRREAHARAKAEAKAVDFNDIMVGTLLQAPPFNPDANPDAIAHPEHMIVTDVIPWERKVIVHEIYWNQTDRDVPHTPIMSQKFASSFPNDTPYGTVIVEDCKYRYPADACIDMLRQFGYTPDDQCRIRGRAEWDSLEHFLMGISLQRKKERVVPIYRTD
ncbi:hypothetical protein K491DRAFT_682459 [Lophiostoma macrostomum CBS 122681]|uniref:Uncharacterized protein n=1 Tax=Lophiostoma macrostomum CBS 122681 TaxID=1314788 RepID=A0A6A6SVK6_9PLEO|nr:hypothetical protein K491DRAFT_682459 [Lophiostoma macrostomum CBS 122681]